MRRFDLHVHTAAGSLDASIQPHALAPAASSWGLDGVVVAEHLSPWSRQHDAPGPGPLLIAGLEVGFGRDHLVVLLAGGVATADARELRAASGPAELAGIVRARGDGIVVLAHPFRYSSERWPADDPVYTVAAREILDHVDAIEVVNGGCTDAENRMASELARHMGMPVTAGSDAHTVEGVGYAFLELASSVSNAGGLIEQILDSRNEAHIRRNRRYVQWDHPGAQPTQTNSSLPRRLHASSRMATA